MNEITAQTAKSTLDGAKMLSPSEISLSLSIAYIKVTVKLIRSLHSQLIN